MRKLMAYVAVAMAVCAGGVWAADAPATSPQQIAAEREAGMKKMAGNIKAASDPSTKPADARAKLDEAIKFAETIPSHFPKGTGIGDPGITHSRALQDIWKKPAEFKAAADALVAALKAADAALSAGDQAKVDAAFGDVRKACGGCHTPFRGPETE